MYRQTQAPVYNLTLLDNLLGCLDVRPAGALLTTPKIELYTNNLLPQPNTAYAAFTKATFTGYSSQAVTLGGTPVNLANGDQARIASVSFVATSGATPETIYGYILSDGAANVYMAELFSTPVAISGPGDFLEVDLILPAVIRPMPVP